jgi:hypothetical protein
MYKIHETVESSGYKVWKVLSGYDGESILCTCETKESAELIVEALTVLDELNKGYF